MILLIPCVIEVRIPLWEQRWHDSSLAKTLPRRIDQNFALINDNERLFTFKGVVQ